jgi:hypothetical protein
MKGDDMLSTDKISGAFSAICDIAAELKRQELPEDVKAQLSTIISIAKHQNDIRGAAKGSCKANRASKA